MSMCRIAQCDRQTCVNLQYCNNHACGYMDASGVHCNSHAPGNGQQACVSHECITPGCSNFKFRASGVETFSDFCDSHKCLYSDCLAEKPDVLWDNQIMKTNYCAGHRCTIENCWQVRSIVVVDEAYAWSEFCDDHQNVKLGADDDCCCTVM